MLVLSTNLKRDSSNTEDSLCNWVQLTISCTCSVGVGELTSVKIAPYLIALSTDFSINSPISGEYSLSNPSSAWSDERRASACDDISSWRECAVATYERYHLQIIVILEILYASQRQYPLSFSIRGDARNVYDDCLGAVSSRLLELQ
jgi:hypothetical protein